MKTEPGQRVGLVPSLDDLKWEWEAQCGGPLQDSLLCSVLPTVQKPSVAFVEPNESIEYGYEHMDYNNMELDDTPWYTNNLPGFDLDSSNVMLDSSFKFDNHFSEPEAPSMPVPDFFNLDLHNDQFMQELEHNRGFSIDEDVIDYGRQSAGSYCSGSSWESNGNASEATELSPEEIFEEIQRECAEIERRSSSPSESSLPVRKKRTSKKQTTTLRKKELNRIAATKYREKKRIEREEKLKELQVLEERNRELRVIHDSLDGEINYLKNLIKEIHGR